MMDANLREEFPVTERWTFLDHAAVAPLPRRTAKTLGDYAAAISANGSAAVGEWVRRMEDARAAISQLLQCDPLDIALTKNTSEAIGIVAEGFPWRDGDNVVLPAEEYPSNQYPWMNLASRGVSVRGVTSRGNRVALDDLRSAMDARTRVLALSSVQFASGFRSDLDRAVELCRDRGIALCLDAIQSIGAFPLDLGRWPIDFVACGGHKWLLGPQGTGFLYVRREWIERLRPIGVGANSVEHAFDYGRIEFKLKPNAGRWESGTMNFGGFAALGDSVRWLNEIGVGHISAHVRMLTDELCERATTAGLRVFSSREADDGSGIVSLETPGAEPRELAARAKAARVIVAVRGGRLRVSPHCYNTRDDIDRLIDAIR